MFFIISFQISCISVERWQKSNVCETLFALHVCFFSNGAQRFAAMLSSHFKGFVSVTNYKFSVGAMPFQVTLSRLLGIGAVGGWLFIFSCNPLCVFSRKCIFAVQNIFRKFRFCRNAGCFRLN